MNGWRWSSYMEHSVAAGNSSAALRASRHTVLSAALVIVVLLTLPGAVSRLIETGNLYLFTDRFFGDVLGRLSGPGRLRFIFQPLMAIFLGGRDGLKDARASFPPFLWGLLFGCADRRHQLRKAFDSTRDLVAVAILLDIVSQALIFHEIRPGAAIVVGPVLIAVPYCVARAIANRVQTHREHGHADLPRTH